MQTSWRTSALATVSVALALAGCAPPRPAPAEPDHATAGGRMGEGGYLTTPEILQAERTAGGGVGLTGRAPPGSVLRLVSPEGDRLQAAAGADGIWRLHLPFVGQARMFAMAADLHGRQVHAQGALLTLPPPASPALLLRAGYGALPPGRPAPRPVILAVDYDPAGFAAVAGLAPAHTPVRLWLDGAMAGDTRADALGRFSVLAANHPLPPGPHAVAVSAPSGRTEVSVPVSLAEPLAQPYRGQRQARAWRVDWTPPGAEGALQTTWVLDPQGQGG